MQKLIYGDELLNGFTLSHIQPGATVRMAIDHLDFDAFAFQTFVKVPAGNTLILKLTTEDSVEYVKAWIAVVSGIPVHAQRLM